MKTLTLSAALLALLSTAAFAADPFTLTSSNFKDNTMMDAKHAGAIKTNPNCIGQNVSPQLTWKNTPAAAKSLVLVMSDWEGQSELGTPSDKFTGGKETAGTTVYRGPCTPPNTGIHHYIFTVIATDLEPGALPPALTRDELWEKLKGHAKGVAGLVGLFGRP